MCRFIKHLLVFAAAFALQIHRVAIACAQPTYEPGQQVIVDDKPGAGNTLCTAAAAKSAPDGYAPLMGGTTGRSTAPYLYKTLAYDPRRGLVQAGRLPAIAMSGKARSSLAPQVLD